MSNPFPVIILASFVLTVTVLIQTGNITPNQQNSNRFCLST